MKQAGHKPLRTETPLVSIIIPAYNVAQYIGEAIDSVLQQDFTQYEIIVINDGSSDTPELERVLKPFSQHIIYVKQENEGISAARNVGLQTARGKYIALLDADDVWLPYKLSTQLEYMTAYKYGMIYADALLFGESPWPVGTTFMDKSPSEGEVSFESLLDLRCTVVVSTVIVLKSLLTQIGGFDEDDRNITEDFDAWLRLARTGASIGYQSKVLAKYRYRADSVSAKRIKLHEAAMNVLNKVRQTMDLDHAEAAALERTEKRLMTIMAVERSKTLIVEGDFDRAFALLSEQRKTTRSWKIPVTLLALRAFPILLQKYLMTRHRPE
ncbi:MAG TPA: glycosyltransferase family A protein [Pyrinomonadaceae bacterium]|nr:glycosyltransferase family A protein [Pyrinomonadaceae bacterium]